MNYLRLTLVLFLFSSSPLQAMGELSSLRIKDPVINKVAPDAVLSDSDGKTASVIGSRKGNKAILIFWATWCPNCYGELGTINDELANIEKKGIKVILIDVGETREIVKEYFLRRKMKLDSFVDMDSALQGPYHLIGIPTLVFVDGQGIIRSMTHAFPSDYEDYFH